MQRGLRGSQERLEVHPEVGYIGEVFACGCHAGMIAQRLLPCQVAVWVVYQDENGRKSRAWSTTFSAGKTRGPDENMGFFAQAVDQQNSARRPAMLDSSHFRWIMVHSRE